MPVPGFHEVLGVVKQGVAEVEPLQRFLHIVGGDEAQQFDEFIALPGEILEIGQAIHVGEAAGAWLARHPLRQDPVAHGPQPGDAGTVEKAGQYDIAVVPELAFNIHG